MRTRRLSMQQLFFFPRLTSHNSLKHSWIRLFCKILHSSTVFEILIHPVRIDDSPINSNISHSPSRSPFSLFHHFFFFLFFVFPTTIHFFRTSLPTIRISFAYVTLVFSNSSLSHSSPFQFSFSLFLSFKSLRLNYWNHSLIFLPCSTHPHVHSLHFHTRDSHFFFPSNSPGEDAPRRLRKYILYRT